MPVTRGRLVVAGLLLLLRAALSPAVAQTTVADTLSFLVTTQSVPTGDFVKDQQSAQVTRDTIARLLLAELTTMPLSSSSGGFTYRFNPVLGTAERASQSFGPFFTERSLTGGAGQVTLGGQMQVARFSHLDSHNLRDGTFVTIANQFRGSAQPFDVETLTLQMMSTTFTFVGNAGLHDRIDLGVAVPFVWLSMEGTRLNVYRGTNLVQASAAADATGFGDLAVRGKFNLLDAAAGGVAVIEEVRLPTGREQDLLGAGQASFRTVFIASSEVGIVGVHGNFGATIRGLSEGLDYRGAVTVSPIPQLTVVGELLGRYINDLGRLAEDRVAHPRLAGVDTMRLTTTAESMHTVSLVIGTKWNVSDTWLVNANVLVPLTDRGLRSDVRALFGFDYAFTR